MPRTSPPGCHLARRGVRAAALGALAAATTLAQGLDLGLDLGVGLDPGPSLGDLLGCRTRVAAPARRLEDPAELEAFLDGVVGEHRATLGTPGVVVSVVKDGKPFLEKGWGLAELEGERPVSPTETLFRVGSLSKVLVATVLAQLAEAGDLRLDDPVGRHLPGLVPEVRGFGPVRLDHLLTHTAGFDERLTGIAARHDHELLPLGEFLAAQLPPRVRPPGEIILYSNHGLSLAGRVIEAVTGEAFGEVMRARIFEPLGMRTAAFQHHPEHEDQLAHPYARGPWGAWRRLPRYEFQIGPAASLRASAHDIGRFMRAHLEGGALGGRRILSPEATAAMQRPRVRHHPWLPGMALGWFEGPRGVGHAGGSLPSASVMVLVPAHRTGIFVSSNALTGAALLRGVAGAFLDRYFPLASAPEAPAPPAAGAPPLPSLTGTYRLAQLPRSTGVGMALRLLPATAELVVFEGPGGELRLRHDLTPLAEGVALQRVDPWAFRTPQGALIAFGPSPDGPAERLHCNAFLPLTFERIPPAKSRRAMLYWLGLLVLALGAGSLGAVAGRAWRAWRHGFLTQPPLDGLAGLRMVACLGHLAALTTPLWLLFPTRSWLPAACYGTPAAATLLGWLAVALVPVGPALLALALRRRRPVEAAMALALLGASAFEVAWRLVPIG